MSNPHIKHEPSDPFSMRVAFLDRAPDCSRCDQPIEPGVVTIVNGFADTTTHEVCPPWKPIVIDGDGRYDAQPQLPLLTLIDGHNQ